MINTRGRGKEEEEEEDEEVEYEEEGEEDTHTHTHRTKNNTKAQSLGPPVVAEAPAAVFVATPVLSQVGATVKAPGQSSQAGGEVNAGPPHGDISPPLGEAAGGVPPVLVCHAGATPTPPPRVLVVIAVRS